MATSNANTKKAMDVSKPGKVAADASARPVIVSHRPQVQDPMVKPETEISELEPASEKPVEPQSALASGEKVIEPLHNDIVAVAKDSQIPTTDTPNESIVKDEVKAPADNQPKKSASSEAAEVDAIADQAGNSKQKAKQDEEQAAAQQAHLQKLIDDKKYFVKIGQVARRRNNRIAVVLLVVLLLGVGVYVAIDAKLLKVGFDVPIHIINN